MATGTLLFWEGSSPERAPLVVQRLCYCTVWPLEGPDRLTQSAPPAWLGLAGWLAGRPSPGPGQAVSDWVAGQVREGVSNAGHRKPTGHNKHYNFLAWGPLRPIPTQLYTHGNPKLQLGVFVEREDLRPEALLFPGSNFPLRWHSWLESGILAITVVKIWHLIEWDINVYGMHCAPGGLLYGILYYGARISLGNR